MTATAKENFRYHHDAVQPVNKKSSSSIAFLPVSTKDQTFDDVVVVVLVRRHGGLLLLLLLPRE
jgi:hypothetical protein